LIARIPFVSLWIRIFESLGMEVDAMPTAPNEKATDADFTKEKRFRVESPLDGQRVFDLSAGER
jgi:hypothetical protein